MSDEKWLRDGLADAVPEPPATPDRARRAERLARRRRRTTAAALVGTVGVVAGAAVLTAALAGGDDDRAVDRYDFGAPPSVSCPPAKAEDGVIPESAIDSPDPAAPDAVPEGATAARICEGPGAALTYPDDLLTQDVATLVETVNGLARTDGPADVCTMELGPGFRIVFGYDDGSTFVVSGRLYGCRTLTVGSGYRADPETAAHEFDDLLQAQLGDAEPTTDTTDGPACTTDPPTPTTGRAEDLAEALLCVQDKSGSTASLGFVEIPDDDLATLVADIAANAHATAGIARCYREEPWISGVTTSGDAVMITYQCDSYVLPDGRAWQPSAASQAIIDRLGARAVP
ncbi:hypothetical protein [Nocardioides sp. MH1]|uniref:hypothetical protein n=1 Tax=Nocardioides sp. MH1 TaxID=3242490 RepID=UPI003521DF67